MTDETAAGLGHNNPPADGPPPPFDPAVVEAHNKAGEAFLEAAAEWIANGELKNEEDSQSLADFIAGCKKRSKLADEARAAAKKPHDDAGKAVQSAFLPIMEKMKKAVDKVVPLQTAWLQKKQKEVEAEAARQREAARIAQEEAAKKAAEAASRNDISGEVEAEAAQKEADKQAKAAERLAKTKANVSSATGGGRTQSLRTVIEVEVTSAKLLFMRYQDHPDLIECLRNLAAREARTAAFNVKTDKIAGAVITTSQKAV